MKFKNRMKRAATGLLALAMAVTTLLGSTGLMAYAADTEPNPQPPANGERIFSVDPFDSDHSASYFCVKDTVGNGDIAYNDGEDGEWSGWRGTNGSKSNKIYFDHHNGACFNGTYFDIREYVWQEDCEYYAIRNNGSVREHTDWLKEVSDRSDFRANLEISAYDRVITLSTCAYRFENARYVLHGKLVELR